MFWGKMLAVNQSFISGFSHSLYTYTYPDKVNVGPEPQVLMNSAWLLKRIDFKLFSLPSTPNHDHLRVASRLL